MLEIEKIVRHRGVDRHPDIVARQNRRRRQQPLAMRLGGHGGEDGERGGRGETQNMFFHRLTPSSIDRESVVKGKSVSVRVDLGGRRIIKKKKTTRQRIQT